MNYFDVFELPLQLSIDKVALKKKFFALSRQHHPDYFAQEDAERQQASLETSALLNKAYKTFSRQDETIKYVLTLKGLLEENEKYDLPPAFLMEMMELNETLESAAFDEGERAAFMQQVAQIESRLYQPVQAVVENYKEGVTPEADLLLVKDYYFKKKYIERLKQQLAEKS
jgi:molecular chaperone HscB